ncbi:MAG: hypothetical protein V4488_11005 [Pseudomonadota bacterium]
MQTCIKARVESTEGNLLAQVNVSLVQAGAASKTIALTTRQSLQEPAVKIIVDVACEAQVHREFVLLLDPPLNTSAASRAELAMAQPQPAASGAYPNSVPGADAVRGGKPVAGASPARGYPTNPDGLPAAKPARIAKPPRAPKAALAAKAPKDILKLSDDAVLVPQGLRLSDSLSARPVGADQQNLAELRIAQAELAALLRGDKPEKTSGDQLQAGQLRMQSLQAETNQLKRQSQADKAELEAIKESSYSRNWIVALAGLLLIGLAAIAVLVAHLRRLGQKNEFAWIAQHADKTEAERKMTVEEIVNSVQASYDPLTAASGKPEASPKPMSPLENAGAAALENSVPGLLPARNTGPTTVRPVSVQAQEKMHLPSLEDSNSSTFNFFAAKGSSMKVEEISDVTQEAEFWMSVNDPQRAIEILEPQGAIEVPDSPVPWLYLLDLYRVTKNKPKYDALKDRFILIFNANIPDFETDPADTVSRLLEDFEHLMAKICSLWNSNDILPFLQSLLVDDRDGKRMGFELPVYRDILLLIAIANELERAQAQGGTGGTGGMGGRWSNEEELAIPDVASLDSAANVKNDFNPIDFEVIDFPKSFPPK